MGWVALRVICQTLPDVFVQSEVTVTYAPVNTGGRPSPYASNLIRFPAVPLEGGVNHSFHIASRLNRITSPGWNVEIPTFSSVRQGVDGLSPEFPLLPAGST